MIVIFVIVVFEVMGNIIMMSPIIVFHRKNISGLCVERCALRKVITERSLSSCWWDWFRHRKGFPSAGNTI